MRTAIIQLARHGDVASILPVAKFLHDVGDQVGFFVHPDFAGLLDAVSYVTPELVTTTHRDVSGAIEQANRKGYERIIASQVDNNQIQPPAFTENFITEQWSRAGFLPMFHELPLIFDKRDLAGEANAAMMFIPKEDGRPLLSYCLQGVSSPYEQWREQKRWIIETFGHKYRLLDLGELCVRKVHYLLGLLERSAALLTIDSLVLHLSYATGTPVIAMSRGRDRRIAGGGYYDSEPRQNWIYKTTYPESTEVPARQAMADLLLKGDFTPGRLVRPTADIVTPRILHVTDVYWPESEREKDRLRQAQFTWDHLRAIDKHWEARWFTAKQYTRSSRDIGDERTLPYVRDILDYAVSLASGDDLICFTNNDLCLVPELPQLIRRKLRNVPCCYTHRSDVIQCKPYRTLADAKKGRIHDGSDLFAFKPSWWKEIRGIWPDLFLGCELWDTAMINLMKRTDPESELKPICTYHEMHNAYWVTTGKQSPASKHNRLEYQWWAKRNGF